MANATIVTLGLLVLFSGIISSGWVISSMVQFQSQGNPKDSSKIGPAGPLAYYTSIGVTSISIGMCLVGIALIILGSSPSMMMGGRR